MKKFWLLLIGLTFLAGCKTAFNDQEKLATDEVSTTQENLGVEVVNSIDAYSHCGYGLCIEIKADEPIVFGEPITIRITVTSEEDMADLSIYLTSIPYSHITLEDPVGEEEGVVIEQSEKGILWKVDAKADQPITFVREITTDFSIDEPYYLDLFISTYIPVGIEVFNSLTILFSNGEVNVYYPGTPVPVPSYELRHEGTLPTIYITPGVTIYPTRQPTMTPVPTASRSTPTPTINPYPILSPPPPQPSPTIPPYP